MLLLSVDPGIDTGFAIWKDGLLCYCGLGEVWPVVDRAIIELPQVYPKISAKQANDLITLAVRVGQYKERIEDLGEDAPVRLVHPHTWKGNVPKDIHHPRIWAKLDPSEQHIFNKDTKATTLSKRHNVLDAIGLGLYDLKRLVP